MARIIFYTEILPEVSAFVANYKFGEGDEFVICSTMTEVSETLLKNGLKKEDVCVFIISNEENSQEILSGISHLRVTHEDAKIIVCMSVYSHISKVFELKPDYIMNVSQIEEELMIIVNRLRGKSFEEEGVIFRKNGKPYCINPENIICFFKEDRRVNVMLDNGETIVFRAKLADIYEKLPNYFARCHVSCIINLKKVSRFLGKNVVLAGNSVDHEVMLPVSRPRKNEIKQLIMIQKNHIN